MRDDRDEIKEMLKARIEDLCFRLLPDGRRQGRLWVSHNPVTGDFSQTPEMKIALNRDVGAWRDWRSGEVGDILKLISYLKGHTSFRDTMAWARDFLGLATMRPDERRRLEADARQSKRERDGQAERSRLFKIAKADEKFLSGHAYGAGSSVERHAAAYFEARHCPLDQVPNLAVESIRFHPAFEYWTQGDYAREGGRQWKVKDGPKMPAVLSAMRGPTGLVTAVHCTFLDPLEAKKAYLGEKESAKLIFGEAKGAMMWISHGPEGRPPDMAREGHPLILCEGRETGMSLAIAVPEARVWAAGSLSNMANAPAWMDCISAVIVARDNNEGNRQAEKQLETALEALAKANKPMSVMASHIGDDFNDLMGDDE